MLQASGLPGSAEEVDDGGVGPGHGLGHPLVGQLSPGVEVEHLEVAVLPDGHGHVGLLLVQGGAVHGYPRLVCLEGGYHLALYVPFPP